MARASTSKHQAWITCRDCGALRHRKDFFSRIINGRAFLNAYCKKCHGIRNSRARKQRNLPDFAIPAVDSARVRVHERSIARTASSPHPRQQSHQNTIQVIRSRIIAAASDPSSGELDAILACFSSTGVIDTIRLILNTKGHHLRRAAAKDEQAMIDSGAWKLCDAYTGKKPGVFFRRYIHTSSGVRVGIATNSISVEGSIPRIMGMSNDRVKEAGAMYTLSSIRAITSDLFPITTQASRAPWHVTRLDTAMDFLLSQPVRIFSKSLMALSWDHTRKAPRQKSWAQVGGQVTFGRLTKGDKMRLIAYIKFDERHRTDIKCGFIIPKYLPDHAIPKNYTRAETQHRGSRALAHVARLLEPGSDLHVRINGGLYGFKFDLRRLHLAHAVSLLGLTPAPGICDEETLKHNYLLSACYPAFLRFIRNWMRKENAHEIREEGKGDSGARAPTAA